MPASCIDHLSIIASEEEFEDLIEWYKTVLSPLKYKEIMRFPGAVGMGKEVPDFWVTQKERTAPSQLHFAFTAPDRDTVDSFYHTALAAGGTCNGPPGLRPEYHENYYGAFIIDPVGNNVELVTHNAQSQNE
ncbi:hypothetical protein ASPWEDRAFT_45369 [Aspergillus wentii DTO 134E9]|uniref:VOC domain-containing protein n=1 Tax=Aspergillus wentii DTO 134E9 TaxID=1073089 RepID=A0A1L9R946_ASPWE|nr:uncharacterized protein ASPWEDRAFT_45369 [Aspergillus wentii DTO 134E9]OJJ31444.1 hypothetical protein ASPWEDRAFT_45369 [Aspergillus wentii DTO 134E9]